MRNEEAIESLRKLKSFHNGSYANAIRMAIKALEAQNAVVRMDLPKISEDELKKMLAKMNHQQQLEWIVDGTVPNNFAKDTNVPSNDTISRQDVIELVKNSYYDLAESIEDTWAMVADVEKLPSAQPEIIRCKDCKYRMPYDWMFSEIWRSQNINDYSEDEIGCEYCDMAMKADDFCSHAERRTDESNVQDK